MSIQYQASNKNNKPYTQLKIKSVSESNQAIIFTKVNALIDSGSDVSLITQNTLKDLPNQTKIINSEKFSISGFGGNTIEIIDQYLETDIKIKNIEIRKARLFITTKGINIIGHDLIDLLLNNNFNIFSPKNKLDNNIFSRYDYTLIPHSMKVIELYIPSLNNIVKNRDILIEPPKLSSSRVIFEEGITDTDHPVIIIQNGTNEVFNIDMNTWLGRYQFIDTIDTKDTNFIQRISELEDDDYKSNLQKDREEFLENRKNNLVNFKIDESKINVGPVQEKVKSKLLELINRAKILFKQSETDRGWSPYVEKFDFINGEPDFESLYTKPHKCSPVQMEAIKPEIQKLLDSSSITCCSSAANVPMFAVIGIRPGSTKPKVRLVQNFKKLNAEISERKYPVSAAQEILERAGKYIIEKSKKSNKPLFFTGLDLASAFHMISLHRDDHLLTAFTFLDRQWCYTVMPFGVKTSPATFNFVLHKILEKVLKEDNGVFTYLDDVLVIGTEEETLNLLKDIFECFEINGVVCSLNKCIFMANEIAFLGKQLTRQGVKELRKQLDKILNFDRPNTIKQVQKFLGYCCYVLSRVPFLNSTLGPLQKLAGSKEKFLWSSEHEESFRNAQDLMQHAIETSHFDPKAKVFVCSDASKYAVGYSLGNEYEKEGKVDRKICCLGSKRIPEKLVTASSRTLEVYGILLTLKILRWTLLGIENITVYTDNTSAVQFLQNPKNLVDPIIPQRIRNLFPLFMELQVNLVYLSDKNPLLGLSDFLSRFNQSEGYIKFNEVSSMEQKSINILKSRVVDTPLFLINIKMSDIIGKQKLDDFCIRIKALIARNSPLKFRNKFYKMDNLGTLKCGSEALITNLVVIPKILQDHLVHQIHIYFLHAGYNKIILELRKQNLFIPKLHLILDKVVSRCLSCQLRKTPRKPLVDKQPKLPATHPFTQFEIDLFSTESWDIKPNFCLVVIDRFSLYIFVEPLLSKNSFEVAQKLTKIIITNGFELATFNSDQGTEFQGTVEEVSKILPITRFTTSPYNPSSNGVVEFSNMKIKSGLQQFKIESNNFESILGIVVAKINRSPCKKLLGLSPFEIFFGRHSPLLIPEESFKFQESHKGSTINQWLSYVSETRNEIAQLGIINFQNYLENFEATSSERVQRKDLVITLANCGHTLGRKNGPLDFVGPFLVKQVKAGNRAILICPLTGRKLNRNLKLIRKLKLNQSEREKILGGHYTLQEGELSLHHDANKRDQIDEPKGSTKISDKNCQNQKDSVQNPDLEKDKKLNDTIDRWSSGRKLRSLKKINYKE